MGAFYGDGEEEAEIPLLKRWVRQSGSESVDGRGKSRLTELLLTAGAGPTYVSNGTE